MCNQNSRKKREDCDRKIFEETWSETYLNLVKKKKKHNSLQVQGIQTITGRIHRKPYLNISQTAENQRQRENAREKGHIIHKMRQ